MQTEAEQFSRPKYRRPVERPLGGFDPHPATWIATFFYTGFFPIAPATLASAVVAVLMWISGTPPLVVRLALFGAVLVVGTWAAHVCDRRYGHDARCIVIDEVAGMLATTLFVPWDLPRIVLAFLLFRALDVLKPPPARQMETLPGGWGVMADDVVAGFYGLALLLLAGLLIPSL